MKWWNRFDVMFLLVVGLEAFVFPWVTSGSDTHFRPLRLLRLLRIFRVYFEISSLRILMHAIISSIPTLAVLLGLQLYIMYFLGLLLVNWSRSTPGVMDTSEYGETDIFYYYFGHAWRSSLSLWALVMADSVFSIINPVLEKSWYIGAALMFYFGFSTMLLYNILIGAICRSVSASKTSERENEAVRAIRGAFKRADPTSTGEASLLSYETKIRPRLAQLTNIDVHRVDGTIRMINSVAAAESLENDHRCMINTEEFTNTYLKLSKSVQAQDLVRCLAELDSLYMAISDTVHHPNNHG